MKSIYLWATDRVSGARWAIRAMGAILVGMALFSAPNVAFANEAVRQFAQELLEHEARQMRQPNAVVRYSDGEAGAALRKLMAQPRAAQVLDAWYAAQLGGQGADMPDIINLLKPLTSRYAKAFQERPRDFGEEYLDAMQWTVLVLRRSSDMVAAPVPPASAATPEEAKVLKQLMEASSGMVRSVMSMIQQGLRKQIEQGMFAPELVGRAMVLQESLSPDPASPKAAQTAPVLPRTGSPPPYAAMEFIQKLRAGETQYLINCAACHGPDGRGSGPIPSLIAAPALGSARGAVNTIVHGSANRKPRAMPAWPRLSNDDVAALANYVRYKFTGDPVEFIDPDAVRELRR